MLNNEWIGIEKAIPAEMVPVMIFLPEMKNKEIARRIQLKNGNSQWKSAIDGSRIVEEISHWRFLPDDPE